MYLKNLNVAMDGADSDPPALLHFSERWALSPLSDLESVELLQLLREGGCRDVCRHSAKYLRS